MYAVTLLRSPPQHKCCNAEFQFRLVLRESGSLQSSTKRPSAERAASEKVKLRRNGDQDWREGAAGLRLEDGSRVAVLGGGPAGSFFSYFLGEMAGRVGLDLAIDVYEARDFSRTAPHGCNMCGGIISESLVQHLATEGINLSSSVIQRGIDSYMLHTDTGTVRIEAPVPESRIGAVHRGAGPRDLKERKWESFDGHLLGLTKARGAQVVQVRVEEARIENGHPVLKARGMEPQRYDLLAVTAGINAGTLKVFEGLGFGYAAPPTTKTFIREYFLGEERIGEVVGSSMHVFLLNLPRLEFAAVIPKGDYVSVCLLGDDIDDGLVQEVLGSPEVRSCFPPDWTFEKRSCQCSPRISVGGATEPFADRIVFIGDCAVTRLYKDGIGAAYRTAKVAARTAVFEGISADAFRRNYEPALDQVRKDNRIGKFTFGVTRLIQKHRFARRAVVWMTRAEQGKDGPRRRMSGVLWDMFTGSASYRSILLRTLSPAFWLRFLGYLALALLPIGRGDGRTRRGEG